jgi:hypothetical protein
MHKRRPSELADATAIGVIGVLIGIGIPVVLAILLVIAALFE